MPSRIHYSNFSIRCDSRMYNIDLSIVKKLYHSRPNWSTKAYCTILSKVSCLSFLELLLWSHCTRSVDYRVLDISISDVVQIFLFLDCDFAIVYGADPLHYQHQNHGVEAEAVPRIHSLAEGGHRDSPHHRRAHHHILEEDPDHDPFPLVGNPSWGVGVALADDSDQIVRESSHFGPFHQVC